MYVSVYMKVDMTSEEAFRYLRYVAVVLGVLTAWAVYAKKYGKEIKIAWIVYAIACFVAGLL